MLLESRSQHRCHCPTRRKPEYQLVLLSLWNLDGVLISHDSSLGVLKAAAAKLNLSTAGSKSRLFSRVKGYLEKQRLALELELAADAESTGERQPRVQPVPRAPSEAEKFLHECTHIPYKPWCPHCVTMRAMPDRSEFLKEGTREVPIVEFRLQLHRL